MKVLVCGGRDYGCSGEYEEAAVFETEMNKLHSRHNFKLVIHGGDKGADSLAGKWAEKNGIDLCVFPANWKHHGKRAGYIRNLAMAQHGKPDLVVAFSGGRGTEMMIRIARNHLVKVIEVGP